MNNNIRQIIHWNDMVYGNIYHIIWFAIWYGIYN